VEWNKVATPKLVLFNKHLSKVLIITKFKSLLSLVEWESKEDSRVS